MRFSLLSCQLPGHSRVLSRLCGLLVLTLGAVLGGTDELLASCGDYLHHAADEVGSWRTGQASPERLPCRGPGCSKSKAPLQIPPVPVTQFSFNERGWLPSNVDADLARTAARFSREADAGAGPQPLRDRLERPPQAL